ncbi:MAG TPA: hypothetical protein IGR64_13545 [Leptolyngbyaceae cyanobacterium M65_K2018_010]|nr:hypothetical protein [Leptolyngbyaceae cyanobacterium M65_K2018_010]
MLSPDLARCLSHPPSYPLTTALSSVVATLSQIDAPWPSHIVVLDGQQRPLGALALGQLWVCQQTLPFHPKVAVAPATAHGPIQTVEATHPPQPPAELSLGDCQPWLEAVAILPGHTTLAELGCLIQAFPQACWVVVNDRGQYAGVIDPVKLSAWLAPTLLGPASPWAPPSLPLAQVGLDHPPDQPGQSWIVSLGHALKTPLTSLLGLSTLLLDPRVGPLSDRQAHYARLMQQAIRKLMRLINQLIDWMRLETQAQELPLAPVEIQPLLENLLPTFLSTELADEADPPAWVHGFNLTLLTDPPPVMADRLWLQQSLHGILDRWLRQGMEPGGLILDQWGAWLAITLWAPSPTGTGPPWAREAEVLPSSRGNDFLEQLSWTLAQRCAQAHGGDLVAFESAVYGYQCTLLISPGEVQPTPLTHLVLLVSDHRPRIDQVFARLQNSPYRLIVASPWHRALDLAQRLQPTVVLLDDESLAIAPALALRDLAPPQAPSPHVIVIGAATEVPIPPPAVVLATHDLDHHLRPTLDQLCGHRPAALGNITLLLLSYPAPGTSLNRELSQTWKDELQRHHCRLLEADDLTQAALLCRVWQPNAILFNSLAPVPPQAFQDLALCPDLASLPLVTLAPLTIEHPAHLTLIDGSATLAQPPYLGAPALLGMIPATAAAQLTTDPPPRENVV